jgi:hypothetical protein
MCQEIFIKDGPNIDTVAEALEFFGLCGLPTDGPGVVVVDGNVCLCGIDFEALANATGYEISPDPFGAIFTKTRATEDET